MRPDQAGQGEVSQKIASMFHMVKCKVKIIDMLCEEVLVTKKV